MRKILIIFFILFLSSSIVNSAEKEPINDYLYSAEYFDYLIECAEIEKAKEDEMLKNQEVDIILTEDGAITTFDELDVISDNFEPFKLRIETNSMINPYGETFIKENSKTYIPVGDKFSFVQDLTKTRNKYSSHDYKILAGAEIKPFSFFNIATGMETNFRGIDQNPASRKLYLSPSLFLGDKLSLTFHNKINVQSRATDHDIGIKLSPFKSKFMDFGVYAGLTRTQAGAQSESVNFSTNLYFY